MYNFNSFKPNNLDFFDCKFNFLELVLNFIFNEK